MREKSIAGSRRNCERKNRTPGISAIRFGRLRRCFRGEGPTIFARCVARAVACRRLRATRRIAIFFKARDVEAAERAPGSQQFSFWPMAPRRVGCGRSRWATSIAKMRIADNASSFPRKRESGGGRPQCRPGVLTLQRIPAFAGMTSVCNAVRSLHMPLRGNEEVLSEGCRLPPRRRILRRRRQHFVIPAKAGIRRRSSAISARFFLRKRRNGFPLSRE